MQGSARKDVVFGAAGVYPVTVPGPKWKSWINVNSRLLCSLLLAVLSGFGCGPAADQEPFTIVMLPDTQFYAEKYPTYFHDQTEWVRQNAEKENIVFVTQVGDIVQNGDAAPDEWKVADEAFSRLKGVVPWGVAIGNHDYDLVEPPGSANAFRKTFGPQRFAGNAWYEGNSENELNSYQWFSGGGSRFLIFHLEADIPDEAIAWVEGVLERHPGTPAIVSTHIYMSDETKSRSQEEYYRKDVGNSGEAVWNKLIRENSQIFMVLCGHWTNAGGEWHQVSANNAGQPVFEILADYQSRENGGNGWLRLITFVPKENQIQFRTYSPLAGSIRNRCGQSVHPAARFRRAVPAVITGFRPQYVMTTIHARSTAQIEKEKQEQLSRLRGDNRGTLGDDSDFPVRCA